MNCEQEWYGEKTTIKKINLLPCPFTTTLSPRSMAGIKSVYIMSLLESSAVKFESDGEWSSSPMHEWSVSQLSPNSCSREPSLAEGSLSQHPERKLSLKKSTYQLYLLILTVTLRLMVGTTSDFVISLVAKPSCLWVKFVIPISEK